MLKLDMAKAYDLMDWEFKYAIHNALRFDQIWIDRIRQFISECQFLVLLNGRPVVFSFPLEISDRVIPFTFFVHYRYGLLLSPAFSVV